jgi:site-specific recombinase XerD
MATGDSTDYDTTPVDFMPAGEAPQATRKRKLHLGHIAFMRAVVQGLDTRESWDRYLRLEGEHDDIRNVRRTIQWIRDEFAAAAKRYDRHGTARLVQIDVSHIVDKKPTVPSLEEFALEFGLEEFSEAEQLEQYQERYGSATARESRRSRLIARQLEALLWLEGLVVQPPQASDALASWLHPDLVRYLEEGGIFTVAQLVERINGIGLRWCAGIRAIGAAKADRIVEWLRTHEASIGLAVGPHVKAKRSTLALQELRRVVPRATAIVPIDKFIVPAELDGSDGAYRAPRHLCLLPANNDYEAVLAWISAKPGLSAEERAALQRKRGIDPAAPEGPQDWLHYLSNTQRAYLKEAERFLLWAIVQRKKPLSSMTPEDCEAYRLFLADPAPRELWCGPRGREKWSPLWRPFEGPLSPSAQHHAVTILKSLYQFLAGRCYLIGNPWNGISLQKTTRPRANKERRFTRVQWDFLEGQLALLPETSANQRLHFALHLIYGTGLRLAEAVAARVDHLAWVSYPADGDDESVAGWQLKVTGKGGKERLVPVPSDVMDKLSRYLASRGLPSHPHAPENGGAFLLGKAVDVAERAPWSPETRREIDPRQGIAPGTLYDQMKEFFARSALVLAKTDSHGALQLASASTHWLRHTHGSHSVALGMPLEVLQQNLGHASLHSTTIYATSEERKRMKAMQKIWDGRDGKPARRLGEN